MENEKPGNKLTNFSRVYIIAEAGVNHNGNLATAKDLIKTAKECGADCVKFQTFKAENVVTSYAPKAKYQLTVTDENESQLQMLKKLELRAESHRQLVKYCKQIGINFLSTPYSDADVALLEEIGVEAFKIASGQIVEPAFLKRVARTGKPMFLSTGMATLAEVDEAVRTVRAEGIQFVVMQCTTNYPSSPQDANLLAIPTMAAVFDTIMGYSDHTETNTACVVAVGLGAKVIEKHLTLDKNMPGPDHAASAEPAEFKQLIEQIREAELTLGTGRKEPCETELLNARCMRRSLVASRRIKQGEVLREEMIAFKRPGTGIPPAMLRHVTGCVATRNIEHDELITWAMCGERKCRTSS